MRAKMENTTRAIAIFAANHALAGFDLILSEWCLAFVLGHIFHAVLCIDIRTIFNEHLSYYLLEILKEF